MCSVRSVAYLMSTMPRDSTGTVLCVRTAPSAVLARNNDFPGKRVLLAIRVNAVSCSGS